MTDYFLGLYTGPVIQRKPCKAIKTMNRQKLINNFKAQATLQADGVITLAGYFATRIKTTGFFFNRQDQWQVAKQYVPVNPDPDNKIPRLPSVEFNPPLSKSSAIKLMAEMAAHDLLNSNINRPAL